MRNNFWSLFWFYLRRIFSFKKSYQLVVFQNNNELRAGGGFITKAAIVEMGRFWIKAKFFSVFEDFKKSGMEIDEDLKKYLKVEKLFFRDSNVSLNFSENAKNLLKLFQDNIDNIKPESVLAINFSMVESLVEAINFNDNELAEKSLFYFFSARVRDLDLHDKEILSKRKNVLLDFGVKIFKSAGLKFWKWPRFIKLVNKMFEAREIQFYDKKETEEDLKSRNLNNHFFAVKEFNLMGGKSNRYVHNLVQEKIGFERDKIKMFYEISFDHLGMIDYPISSLYQAKYSILIPRNAKNIKFSGGEENLNISENQELGTKLTEVSFVFRLLPRKRAVSKIAFEIPFEGKILEEGLALNYRKSSGKNLEIKSFLYGDGWYWLKNSQSELKRNWQMREYSGVATTQILDKDIFEKIYFIKDQKSLRLCEHKAETVRRLKLILNEEVLDESLEKCDFLLMREGSEEVYARGKVEEKKGRVIFIRLDHAMVIGETYRLKILGVKNKFGIGFDSEEERFFTIMTQ